MCESGALNGRDNGSGEQTDVDDIRDNGKRELRREIEEGSGDGERCIWKRHWQGREGGRGWRTFPNFFYSGPEETY